MLSFVLQQCNERISKYPCCNTDENHICNCVGELANDYNCELRPDTYNCQKKMDTYVIRYGVAYASEIYHYLVASDFKSKINLNQSIIVKSLGCCFSPDYYAIKQYLNDNKIQIPIEYTGLDNSSYWNFARPNTPKCNYLQTDLTLSFDIAGADIVIVGKVFSTLYRNKNHITFLDNFKTAISTLKSGTIVIFIDVNHQNFGRDNFHNSVSRYLTSVKKYYFNPTGSCYIGNGWEEISQNNLVFNTPYDLSFEPIKKTIIFEYRK